MDDGYTWQFTRDDAEHAIKRAEGCGECPDIEACKLEGACLIIINAEDENEDE